MFLFPASPGIRAQGQSINPHLEKEDNEGSSKEDIFMLDILDEGNRRGDHCWTLLPA
jgi:hypothetical protein